MRSALATQPTPDPNPSPSSQPYDADGATVEHDPAKAKGRTHYDGDVALPAFLTAKNLKPFIAKELEVTSSQLAHDPAKAKAMCTVCGDLVHMDDADEHCAGHGR